MVSDISKSAAARRGILALLMLGVLTVSVAAAWLLEHSAAVRVRAGKEIIQEIRGKGLEQSWPEKKRTDWYIVKHGSRLIGWSAIVRDLIKADKLKNDKPEKKDKFVGLSIEADTVKRRYRREIWTLNADATSCEYHTLQGILRLQPVEQPKLGIFLTNGKIRLVRHDLNIATKEISVPDDYLPQGLLEPVLHKIAAKKADAQFRVVPGNVPDLRSDPHIRFVTARYRYIGTDNSGSDGPVHRVELSTGLGGETRKLTYELNRGRIASITSDDGRQWVAVDEKTVSRVFKHAPQLMKQFLLQTQHDWER